MAGGGWCVEALRTALKTYWGYADFRPLQAEAMRNVTEGRDSVVVLPTGGGKSLCFQAPAMVMPGLAVVVSPLISLMKDQVDALVDCGIPAAYINSSMTADERRHVADLVSARVLKLLYLSPERLTTSRTIEFLQRAKPAFFAIDEAHCISDWGHDFRPEYRALKVLKQSFPGVAVHAYTATATERVRGDVARELGLENPEILVGSFDRPNLVYRVMRRTDRMSQINEIIDRHAGESGIIYCIRRTDVETVCASLVASGRSALPYHAGLEDGERRRNQEAFIKDKAKIIVATVAFGMGIDKSDVRYVIHGAAPKSLESYQQESGRAGRDGLEAECCMLYSPADFLTWRKLQSDLPPAAAEAAMTLLAGLEKFCTTLGCRHRAIVNYFGQGFEIENCKACDACLEELEFVADPLIVSQKILSCVVRLQENFGAAYTAKVLVGSREQKILEAGHDRLSTYGLLSAHDVKHISAWIEQLVEQEFLCRTGEYRLISVTPAGWEVLRGKTTPRLLQPAKKVKSQSKAEKISWEGVERGLFEHLRALRRQKAEERSLPPFVVFGDATLRDMARRRPSTNQGLLAVHGVGERKRAQYGDDFLAAIVEYCQAHDLAMDVEGDAPSAPAPTTVMPTRVMPAANETKRMAYDMFSRGKSLDEVAVATGRVASTVCNYLAEFVQAHEISDVSPWVEDAVFEQVRLAGARVGFERLKPVFEALNGTVSYDTLRLVAACLKNIPPEDEGNAAEDE